MLALQTIIHTTATKGGLVGGAFRASAPPLLRIQLAVWQLSQCDSVKHSNKAVGQFIYSNKAVLTLLNCFHN